MLLLCLLVICTNGRTQVRGAKKPAGKIARMNVKAWLLVGKFELAGGEGSTNSAGEIPFQLHARMTLFQQAAHKGTKQVPNGGWRPPARLKTTILTASFEKPLLDGTTSRSDAKSYKLVPASFLAPGERATWRTSFR